MVCEQLPVKQSRTRNKKAQRNNYYEKIENLYIMMTSQAGGLWDAVEQVDNEQLWSQEAQHLKPSSLADIYGAWCLTTELIFRGKRAVVVLDNHLPIWDRKASGLDSQQSKDKWMLKKVGNTWGLFILLPGMFLYNHINQFIWSILHFVSHYAQRSCIISLYEATHNCPRWIH